MVIGVVRLNFNYDELLKYRKAVLEYIKKALSGNSVRMADASYDILGLFKYNEASSDDQLLFSFCEKSFAIIGEILPNQNKVVYRTYFGERKIATDETEFVCLEDVTFESIFDEQTDRYKNNFTKPEYVVNDYESNSIDHFSRSYAKNLLTELIEKNLI